jgi:Flp pilus assembly protein TadG
VSKSDATETALLSYIFTATSPAWAAATELDIHLHTADPGEAGVSTTSEATYTSYAPVTVNRSVADWTVTGDTATNDNLIQFPQCTGGSNTITHVSVTPEGSTTILYSGALSSSLAVSSGIQPQFSAGALDVVES